MKLHEHDGVAVVHQLDCPRCRINAVAPELAQFVEEIATAESGEFSVEEITTRARALFKRLSVEAITARVPALGEHR